MRSSSSGLTALALAVLVRAVRESEQVRTASVLAAGPTVVDPTASSTRTEPLLVPVATTMLLAAATL